MSALFVLFPPEFVVQIGDYLRNNTGAQYAKSLDELIARSQNYTSLGKDGAGPNPPRWRAFVERDSANGTTSDPGYRALHDYYMPMTAALVSSILAKDKLDVLVYPTSVRRPAPLVVPPGPAPTSVASALLSIASLAGLPDLVVPAGFTTDDLPVSISFVGPAFSEPTLLALGFSYEQATHNLRQPVNTPALPDATIEIPDR